METEPFIIDMDNAREKGLILNQIRGLRGFYRVEITRYRRRRTDRQNRYYWPCFVQPFADFLRSQGETVSNAECHELLKYKFLRATTINRCTGEILERVRSTTDLDTREFNTYLEQCAQWLAEQFGIVVPEPQLWHEAETEAAEPVEVF
jgi:hypothetical protein